MTASLPEWITNVPLKTVGLLCAVHIFGKNIEGRHTALTGRRYIRSAVENVVNYALNPILPPLSTYDRTPAGGKSDAMIALRNVRDCFNYIFHIQIEYFKILYKLHPEEFKSKKTGVEFNLNRFSAKNPTLINSEKRYLILCKIDGAQPYDLNLNWNAEIDWIDEAIQERFQNRLLTAQEAYASTLRLGEWLTTRERNPIIPLATIMDNLDQYFGYLSLAAYHMARNAKVRQDENLLLIKVNLLRACGYLERFVIDMLRMNALSIVKHDLGKLGREHVESVVRVRAEEDVHVGSQGFDRRYEGYNTLLNQLYEIIEFAPAAGA